jgi:hypothetical protein
MNFSKIAVSFLAALFVAFGAFTAATPGSVSADVFSLEMPVGVIHGVETCAPGSGVCSVIKVEAEDDDGDLFIKTDGGTLRVVNASVGPLAEPACPFTGSGTSSVTIDTDGCDGNINKNDSLVVTLSLTPDCSAGGVAVGVQVLGEPQTLRSGFATCRPPKGELKVLKDCLIPGPDGKVTFPPPPEGSFEMTLYRGTSTLQDLGIEEVIAVFTLACGQTKAFELEPGTYNVVEFDPDPNSGFGQIANFCINLEVEPGEKLGCNLTNDKVPPIVIRPPSTGNAGLVKPSAEDNTSMLLAAAVAAFLLGFAAFRSARR